MRIVSAAFFRLFLVVFLFIAFKDGAILVGLALRWVPFVASWAVYDSLLFCFHSSRRPDECHRAYILPYATTLPAGIRVGALRLLTAWTLIITLPPVTLNSLHTRFPFFFCYHKHYCALLLHVAVECCWTTFLVTGDIWITTLRLGHTRRVEPFYFRIWFLFTTPPKRDIMSLPRTEVRYYSSFSSGFRFPCFRSTAN